MFNKKALSILLVIAMVLSIFAGCKQGENAGGQSAPGSAPASNVNTVKEPPTLPLVEPGTVELKIALMENNFAQAGFAQNLKVYEEFEKITGVKIKWEVYPGKDYDKIMATRLAAGKDLPDIFVIPWEMKADKIGMDGMARPLNDLIASDAYYLNTLMEMNPEVRKAITAGDGNIYAYPGFGEGIISGPNDLENGEIKDPGANITLFTPGIRKDWLEKLNLEEPKTLDDWYNVLKAFKTMDPNGNGKNDEIPLLPAFDPADLYMFGSGVGLYKKDRYDDFWSLNEDGSLYFMPTDQKFKEILAFYNKLYAEGLLDTEFSAASYTKTLEKVNMDLVGALTGNWNSNYQSFNNNLAAAGKTDANWVSIKMPQDPQGNQKTYNRWSIWKTTAISTTCKNPEIAMKWLDFHCLSSQGITLENFGIEGISYEKQPDGTLKFTDFVVNNSEGLGMYEALRSLGAWGQISYIQTKDANVAVNASNPSQIAFAESFAPEDVMKPLPDTFPYSVEEMQTLAGIQTSITTTMTENNIAFITGQRSLDEFDKYVEELNSIGLEKMIKVTQAAYQRYIES